LSYKNFILKLMAQINLFFEVIVYSIRSIVESNYLLKVVNLAL
jgi:hypothetical protein